jgi:hypothetical protein
MNEVTKISPLMVNCWPGREIACALVPRGPGICSACGVGVAETLYDWAERKSLSTTSLLLFRQYYVTGPLQNILEFQTALGDLRQTNRQNAACEVVVEAVLYHIHLKDGKLIVLLEDVAQPRESMHDPSQISMLTEPQTVLESLGVSLSLALFLFHILVEGRHQSLDHFLSIVIIETGLKPLHVMFGWRKLNNGLPPPPSLHGAVDTEGLERPLKQLGDLIYLLCCGVD